jgi:hypothetical protein
MKSFEAVPILNRLLAVLCRSLPAYLASAAPWAKTDHRAIRVALERLSADQRLYAQRVAEAIVRCGGRPDPGGFPPEFAAKNDLAIGFLLREVIEYQEQDLSAIEYCAAQLENTPALHALAEEILGNAKGHLDALREVAKREG